MSADQRAASGFRVQLGWAAGLLLVAALEFVPSYSGASAPLAFVLAAFLPFALIRLGLLLRVGTFPPALAVIVLGGFGAWFAVHNAGGDSLGGLGNAVQRLLTTPRPARSSAALLAPSVLLVVLVSTIVAAVVLAPPGDSPTRVRGLLAPVLGCAGLYVAAQLLSAGHADPRGIVAVSLLVVAALGWSMPYTRGGLRVAWRPGAVLPLVGAVVLALAVATVLPSNGFDPRRHVTPPTVHLTESSPLTQLAIWSANPNVAILEAQTKGTDRLHLATLADFTGATWEVDDRYQQLGLVDNGDLPAAHRRTAASAVIRIEHLSGVWLPAPGVPTSTSLGDVLVDPDNGTLATPSQVRPGLTYEVHAQNDSPTPYQLAAAAAPLAPPPRYLALPGAPAGFAQYAREAVRGSSTPLEEAVALEHAVSTNRRLDPNAPTGSSYGRLQEFLFNPKGTTGAQAGTAEQFASAFAVLAREVGLASRLVVGFQLPSASGSGPVTVRGKDAVVWPEIYFSGVGWVPFAPTPGTGGSADAGVQQSLLQRLSSQAKIQPTPPAPTPTATAPTGRPLPAGGDDGDAPAASSGLSTGALVGIIAGGALLVVLLLLAGLRLARRSRHRRHGARGAWAEVIDLLVLVGRRPAASATAPDIAADFDTAFPVEASHAATRVAPTGARVLAAAADREAFAPPTGAPTHAVTPVWHELRLLRRRARRTLPRYRRLLLPVDPRPLLRRRARH